MALRSVSAYVVVMARKRYEAGESTMHAPTITKGMPNIQKANPRVSGLVSRHIGAVDPKQRESEKENAEWKSVGRLSQGVACGVGLSLPNQLFAGIGQESVTHRAPQPCAGAWRSPPRRI